MPGLTKSAKPVPASTTAATLIKREAFVMPAFQIDGLSLSHPQGATIGGERGETKGFLNDGDGSCAAGGTVDTVSWLPNR